MLSGEDGCGIKEVYFEFLELLGQKLDHVNEDKHWVLANVRKYIARSLYERLFPRRPTYSDLGAYYRLEALGWVGCREMNVAPENSEEALWQLAALRLRRIDEAKAHEDKLACIDECYGIVNHVLRLTSTGESVGADVVLPILIVVLIKAKPRRLHSSLRLIKQFTRIDGKHDFNIKTLELCLDFCRVVTPKELTGVSDEHFRARVEEREQASEIYFLRRRAFD